MATTDTQLEKNNPAYKIYDPVTGVNADGDTNISLTIKNPSFLSFEGVLAAGLTSIIVEIRLHEESAWITHTTVDINITSSFLEFTGPDSPNFARVVRDGTDDFIVYAQSKTNRT